MFVNISKSVEYIYVCKHIKKSKIYVCNVLDKQSDYKYF